MIYKTLGSGLVDMPQPDTSALMKGALPDVTKMKAAAWGIPELDDIKAPELQYEKDLDISPTNKLDEYYQKGQQLMSNANKLRSVGIDVTNPDPYVEGSIEASSLWSKDYSDWVQLGQQLKQSREGRKSVFELGKRPDVLMVAPPQEELITDVSQYVLPLDEKTVQGVADAWKSNYVLYGQKNLDVAAEDFLKAGQAITDYYDNIKAQSPPQFASQIEERKKTTLARMKLPYEDLKFDKKLAEAQQRLGLGWYKAETQRMFVPKEKVEAGVVESFKDMIEGKGSSSKFYMYSTGQPIIREGKTITDASGNPAFWKAGKFLGIDKKANKVIFEAINENGEKEGTFTMQYLDKDGSLFFERSKFRDVLEAAKKPQGTAFGYGEQPELPIATQYEGEPTGEIVVKTEKTAGKESETKSQTFTIINPQTGKVLGSVKTQEEANKAIAKGYKVK